MTRAPLSPHKNSLPTPILLEHPITHYTSETLCVVCFRLTPALAWLFGHRDKAPTHGVRVQIEKGPVAPRAGGRRREGRGDGDSRGCTRGLDLGNGGRSEFGLGTTRGRD
jgi:hypothetical protein